MGRRGSSSDDPLFQEGGAPGQPVRGGQAPQPRRDTARHLRSSKRMGWLKIVAVVLACALIAGIGVVVVKVMGLRASLTAEPLNLGTGATGLPVDLSTDPVQILILGTDSRDNTGGAYGKDPSSDGKGNSDVMMLMNLSADRERVTVVSLPRDLLTDIPTCEDPQTGQVYPAQEFAQLNTALSYGGPGCTVAAVNELTGMEIDHFMMADFNAVKELSEVIGGVEVCVNEPINDTYSNLVLPAGVSSVQGEQALAFLRTRHAFGDGGDRGRIRAQQSFLASMARKIMSEGTLTNVPRLYNIADAVARNLTVDEGLTEITKLLALADRLKNVDLGKVAFVSLPTSLYEPNPNRLVMDEVEGQKLFEILRNDGDVTAGSKPEPSASPTEAPEETEEPSETAEPEPEETLSFDPSVQPVQVLNGSGAEGRSEEVVEQLQLLGYLLSAPAETVAGAESTSPATQIFYSAGFEDVARALAEELNVPKANVLSSETRYGVTVSVGKDFTTGEKLDPTGGVSGNFTGQTADQVTCQGSGGF
ncbi:cell envelope-related function transcriptional attenuator common domain-containing protein [Arthrobacter crystallopoietes]|uniref:Cell envelope-related function transcriptional attenuator common domain-containing protein n=2 Tax=Crystallibacter crystallopoietes TaxID=37928 RepID=A0A1H1GHG5_9MICC|nr:LytR family transcriptional regulator [Arthrobacter crystallopoietes]SDR12621.1 cell envelope-related function transcriptional attenuator common domain-containing protein [Arthrobacter crystallopoietes]